MFSLIFLELCSGTALKVPAVKSVLPKIKLKKKEQATDTVIHKDKFLEKAIKGFMNHNHQIMAIHHDLTSTMYEYNRARGEILPKLGLVSGVKNEQISGGRSQFGGFQSTSDTSFNYGVQASYVLFNGFANFNGVRAKDFEVQAKLYKGMDSVAQKLLEFIKLILTIQEAELRVDIGNRDVARKQKMYQEAKNRVEVGATGKQDEFQACAALDQALGDKTDAETDFKNTKLKFQEWTGITYEKISHLAIPEELLSKLDELESSLHKTNMSVLQAQADMHSKEKGQKATNGRLFSPKFNLEFNAGNRIGKGSVTDSETNRFSSRDKNTQTELSTNLTCTLPLWSGGSDKSEALQASEAVAASRHGFYSAAQDAKIDFSNAKESFVSAQDDHKLYSSIVENYQKSYDIALDKYQNGASNFTDLTEIADRLNRAEQLLARKDKERCQSAWGLVKIVGSLTPAKLCGSSFDKNFDPFSDYNKIKSRI